MFKANLIALCVLLLSACSAQRLVLSLESTTMINPDAKHQALTLYLKIFQLRKASVFQTARFKCLWRTSKGGQYLSIKTVLVKNKDTQLIQLNLNAKAKYIGFLANFRKGSGKNKILYPVKSGLFSANHLVLHVKHNQLMLEDIA